MNKLYEKIKSKKLFIFDLDGTIVDSIEIWDDIDKALIKFCGDTPRTTFSKEREMFFHEYKGINISHDYEDYIFSTYHLKLPINDIRVLRKNLTHYYLKEHVKLIENVDKILKLLKQKGYMLALATTSSRYSYDIYIKENKNILNYINLNNYFKQNVLTAEDVNQKKPFPEAYLKLQNMFNLKSEQIVIIEDSLTGITAANRANIDCISIYEKNSAHNLDTIKQNSILFINSYNELINILND